MPNYAFSGGINPTQPYGDRWKAGFSGTWVAGDEWSLELVVPASAFGNIMLGLGQLAGLAATVGLNYNNRVYIGLSTRMAFSELGDPTKWEEQNPGAGFLTFLSNFGSQDTIFGLAVFQGRVAIFGRYSIQIWTVNADPAQFQLIQALANIGTASPLSVQQLGDYDVLFLDPGTGIRSLRAREVTLNAFVDDLGLPIDELVQAALAATGNNPSGVCGIVDPVTKRYWLFLTDTIYVLSLYRSSKIAAWTTYKPTAEGATVIPAVPSTYDATTGLTGYLVTIGDKYYWKKGSNSSGLTQGTNSLTVSGYFIANGAPAAIESGIKTTAVNSVLTDITTAAFTPEKFIAYNNQLYIRATNQHVYQYGGASGQQFDSALLTVLLPFLDAKDPTAIKVAQGLSAAFSGQWTFSVGMDPVSGTLEQVLQDGSPSNPDELIDSTFDKGIMAMQMQGTHFQVKAVTGQTTPGAELAQITFKYMKGRRI